MQHRAFAELMALTPASRTPSLVNTTGIARQLDLERSLRLPTQHADDENLPH